MPRPYLYRAAATGGLAGRMHTSTRVQTSGGQLYFERRLPPSTYLVTARLGPYVTPEATEVLARAGEVAPQVHLTLVRGGAVHVRLVDTSGAPQRGGRLTVPDAWALGRSVEPKESGTYWVDSIPPGRWRVEARGAAGHGASTFTVGEGERLELEIVLR